MSFDQLMDHANTIQQKAIWRAVNKHETDPEYARNGVDGYYADIPGLFQPFAGMPDPARYDPLIQDYHVILSKLSSGSQDQDPIDGHQTYLANKQLDKISTASDYLSDWDGRAAIEFKTRFLDPFPSLVKNQFILSSVLKAALEAHQAMWKSARHDIDQVAEATIAALDDDPCCDPSKWSFEFTVLASVAAVATIPLDVATDGMTVPLTVTAVGAAAQAVAAKPPDSIKENHTGNTAVQITNAMKAGITKIESQIHSVESQISNALWTNVRTINGRHDDLAAARPALANAKGGNVTSGANLGGTR